MKRILHLSAVSFTVKNLLLTKVDYLKQQGLDVDLACAPGKEVDEMRKDGYVIHTLPLVRKLSIISNLVNIVQLTKLMREQQYDLVHVHTPIIAVLGRIAARLAGVKRVIYTAHGFPFHDQSPKLVRLFYFNIERFSGLLSDKILSQSQEDVDTAINEKLCSFEKIAYLGNGIDIDRFHRKNLNPDHQNQLRQSLGIPSSASTVIGTIGRLTYKKGSSFLVEAMAELVKSHPDAHALIIGGEVKGDPAPFQTELLQKIHDLGLENNITLTGYRQDTPELLGLLDIFTLPTFTHEGMPRSILEAMAMQLPVVATDIRGCREEVVHGQTGLIVPPKDSQALARAFDQLIENPEQIQRFGSAGRARVEAEFDERIVFERLKEFYTELGIINPCTTPEAEATPLETKLTTA